MLLSFNNCSISALTAPIYQSINAIEENTIFSSQLRTEFHCASPILYHVFLSCDIGLCTFLNVAYIFLEQLNKKKRKEFNNNAPDSYGNYFTWQEK